MDMAQTCLDDYVVERQHVDSGQFIGESGACRFSGGLLHRGAVSIYFYPEGVVVRADFGHVFSKCPKECLEKVVKELLSLADEARGFGVKVYHVGKAFDDDLYFMVEAGREDWERFLRYLSGLGFRTVAKHVFSSFEELKRFERCLDKHLDPVQGLSGLNILENRV